VSILIVRTGFVEGRKFKRLKFCSTNGAAGGGGGEGGGSSYRLLAITCALETIYIERDVSQTMLLEVRQLHVKYQRRQ
jgi:hypothetical protein